MGNGPDLVGPHPSKGGGWQQWGFFRSSCLGCLLLAGCSADSSVHVPGTHPPVALSFQGPVFWGLSRPGNECSPGFMRRDCTSQFLSCLKVTSGHWKEHGRPQEIEVSICKQLPKISHETYGTGKLGSALSTVERKTKTNHLKAPLVEASRSQAMATELFEAPCVLTLSLRHWRFWGNWFGGLSSSVF